MDHQPVDVPPIPAEGLPPGWSIEQWNAYGTLWVQQEQEEAVTQLNTEIATSESGFETELDVHPPITTDDGVAHTPMAEPIPTTGLPIEYEQELVTETLTGSEELAILVGSLCIFYGALDFLMWLIFGVWFPGPFFTPMLFGGAGSAIIHYKSYWNFIELEPFSKSQNTKYVLGGVLGSALLIILVIFLISIADDEIVGTWHNPVQTFTFNSDGTLEDSTGEWSEWRIDGNTLYLTDPDESDVEYVFRYTISNEALFLAPLDDDDSVMSEYCAVYAMEDVSWEDAEYDEWPSWCATE